MRPNIRCAIAILTGALIPIAAFADTTNNVTGHVRTGEAPISLSTVTLYRAGDQKGSGAVVLGSDLTDANGFFSISYTSPTAASAVLYMIAEGPLPSIRLAAVLGTAPVPNNVTINERTTVATAFAMAQFIVDGDIGGKSPGLQNASGTFRNLVDLGTGNVGNVLRSPPNGLDTSTMRIFNSLANLLAGCVSQLGDCAALFDLATPPGGSAPGNTL